jgi:hypothetical protein
MTEIAKESNQSTLDSIVARLAVLESICGATIGIYLANARNDPDFSKSKAMISALRQDILQGVAHLPEHMRKEAALYLENILGQVTRALPHLRGEGSGHTH